MLFRHVRQTVKVYPLGAQLANSHVSRTVVPITSRAKEFPLHVRIDPPEAGLQYPSFAKGEDVRSVSRERLSKPLGRVSPTVLRQVEDRLRLVLGL